MPADPEAPGIRPFEEIAAALRQLGAPPHLENCRSGRSVRLSGVFARRIAAHVPALSFFLLHGNLDPGGGDRHEGRFGGHRSEFQNERFAPFQIDPAISAENRRNHARHVRSLPAGRIFLLVVHPVLRPVRSFGLPLRVVGLCCRKYRKDLLHPFVDTAFRQRVHRGALPPAGRRRVPSRGEPPPGRRAAVPFAPHGGRMKPVA